MLSRTMRYTQRELRNAWRTPPDLAKVLCDMFGIELDVACHPHNAVRDSYISEDMDALAPDRVWHKPWWCNPPFSSIDPWVHKALNTNMDGLMLTPARMGSAWMYLIASLQHRKHVDIYFFRPRVAYEPADPCIQVSSPAFDSMLLHFHRGYMDEGLVVLRGHLDPKTGSKKKEKK